MIKRTFRENNVEIWFVNTHTVLNMNMYLVYNKDDYYDGRNSKRLIMYQLDLTGARRGWPNMYLRMIVCPVVLVHNSLCSLNRKIKYVFVFKIKFRTI